MFLVVSCYFQVTCFFESNSTRQPQTGRGVCVEQPCQRDLGVLVGSSSGWVSSVWPGSQEGKPHPGVHQTQHHQLWLGSSCWIQPWHGLTLSPVCSAGPHSLTRVGRSLDGPEEDNRAGGRAGRHILWGAAEGSGFVWFGQKEAQGWCHCSVELPEEGTCRGSVGLFLASRNMEWFKAVSGEVQTVHQETFLYQEGGQTLEQASWNWCLKPALERDSLAMPSVAGFMLWSALEQSRSWTRWLF